MTCSGSSDGIVAYPISLTGNYQIEFTVKTGTSTDYPSSVVIGFSNVNSGYILFDGDALYYASSLDNYNQLTNFSSCSGLTDGDVFKIIRKDNNLKLYKDNVLKLDYTNSNYNYDGYFGFRQVESRNKVIGLVKAVNI
jgi:hypothetical protein